jgi:hypothetical protein
MRPAAAPGAFFDRAGLEKARRTRYEEYAIGRDGAAMSRHDPQGAAFSFPHEGQRNTKEVIVPSPANSIDIDFVTFLAGDQRAGDGLYSRLKDPLLRRIRRYAPDLPPDLAEDALIQVFVLMMERRQRHIQSGAGVGPGLHHQCTAAGGRAQRPR